MKLKIDIIQAPEVRGGRKKTTTIETTLDNNISMEHLRRIWEAEQMLNSLPSSRLRFHMNVTE